MKNWQVLLAGFSFVIAGCSIGFRTPSVAPIDVDSAYLNSQIRLIAVEQMWPLKTNDTLALLLESNTMNEIVFPGNYNLRIFYQENGTWVEILERPISRDQDQFVLEPDDPLSRYEIVGFWPQYPDPSKTYFLRVYVFGDMTTPDGVKVVGAFVDLVVTPN
jgi:hypothetical protein